MSMMVCKQMKPRI